MPAVSSRQQLLHVDPLGRRMGEARNQRGDQNARTVRRGLNDNAHEVVVTGVLPVGVDAHPVTDPEGSGCGVGVGLVHGVTAASGPALNLS